MNKLRKISLTLSALLIGGIVVMSSCVKEESYQSATGDEKIISEGNSTLDDCGCIINPADTIFPAEIEMLQFMREEEKLARDVYITLYDQYQIPVFNNISKSEQVHMDRVLCLLDHYGIPDPASPEIGVFSNASLQDLYNNLVEQGSGSRIDALTVGATIEDVDIFDLEEYVTQTSNEAIINIFSRLTCGSRNHIRSFSKLLSKSGITYEAQFISQEEYEEIVSSGHEFCGGQN